MTLICSICGAGEKIMVMDGRSVCTGCLVDNFVKTKEQEKK